MSSKSKSSPNQSGFASDVEHLAKLVKGIQFAMMTTESVEGDALRSRPMTVQDVDFKGEFWFFAGKDGTAVQDIQSEPKVNLAFSNPTDNAYVSVTGIAEVIDDRSKAKEMWNPINKAWFPKGVDDPNLTLIRVSVEKADFWESPSSKVVQLIGFAKAIITGKRADGDLGKRGHVDLN